MTDNESARIDQYLFGEMSDAERERFEDRMLADDTLFYSAADRENELVDRHVANLLSNADEERFERSLAKFPARRQKIVNAGLLRTHIEESRKTTQEPAKENVSWFQRLGSTFRAPAFAAAAMAILLIGVIGILLVRNGNLQRELAVLKADQTGDANLSELQKREAELTTSLESEKSLSSDLTSDLDSERERREKLETELADLQKKIANTQPPTTDKPIAPTIATLVLGVGGRRGGQAPARNLALSGDEKNVSVVISLPGDAAKTTTANIDLNGRRLADGLRVATGSDGRRSVALSIPPDKFQSGPNRLVVTDANGDRLGEYVIIKSSK